jgi:virulence-associated protein VagC
VAIDSVLPWIYSTHMIAKIFKSGNSMALRLPKELRPVAGEVEVVALGERWIVSPIKPVSWPKGFFSRIRLSDPTPFMRPPQGEHRDIHL